MTDTPAAPAPGRGPLAHRVLSKVIQRVKRDPGYDIDPQLDLRDLGTEFRRRGIALLRAQWTLRRVPGGRMRFVERGVEIRHRRHLTVGAGSVLEAHARLHCLSTGGFALGRNVTVGKFAILEASGVLWNKGVGLQIGDNSSVGDWSFVGASGGVTIGRRVLMGQRVAIHSQNHNFAALDRPIQQQGVNSLGVVIGDDCWLGSGSIVLDGVELGAGCVVAAGSVVTHSFPPGSVVAGAPARVVRHRDDGPDAAPGSAETP